MVLLLLFSLQHARSRFFYSHDSMVFCCALPLFPFTAFNNFITSHGWLTHTRTIFQMRHDGTVFFAGPIFMKRNVRENPRCTKLDLNPQYKYKHPTFEAMFFSLSWFLAHCSFVCFFRVVLLFLPFHVDALSISNKNNEINTIEWTQNEKEIEKFPLKIDNAMWLLFFFRCVFKLFLLLLNVVRPSRYVSFHLTNCMWYIINHIMLYRIQRSTLSSCTIWPATCSLLASIYCFYIAIRLSVRLFAHPITLTTFRNLFFVHRFFSHFVVQLER